LPNPLSAAISALGIFRPGNTFFGKKVKQRRFGGYKPCPGNKLRCFSSGETSLKQGETGKFQVSSFRSQVDDLVPS